MKVQIDVDAALWRETKAEAAMQGLKLNKFVAGVLRNSLPYSKVCHITTPVDRKQPVESQSIGGVPVPDAEFVASHGQEATRRTGGATPPTGANLPKLGVPVEYELEPVKHQCAICRVSFPEAEMTYHPKTMKWACKDCVDNQKNGQ